MKLLRKLFGAKPKVEPIKAAPVPAPEPKAPKPVISLDVVEQAADESELLKLASDGATSQLRLAAAEKIHSRVILEQLVKAVKTKDKNVFRIAKAKLEVFKEEDIRIAEIEARAERICEKLERHAQFDADALFKAKLGVLQSEWDSLGQVSIIAQARYQKALTACEEKITSHAKAIAEEEEKQLLDAQALQLAKEALISLKKLSADIYRASHVEDLLNANYELKIQELSNAVRLAANRQLPLDKLTKEFEQIKHYSLNLIDQIKTSGTVKQLIEKLEQAENSELANNAQHKLQQLIKSAKDFGDELPEVVAEAKAKIDALRGQRHQAEQAAKNALRDFSELARKGLWAAEQGFVRKARAIQKELEEKRAQIAEIPKGLQAKLDDFEAQLTKLGDWHEFAVTPKKEALITQMQALDGSDTNPEALATKIHELQDNWKEVSKGVQQQDDVLWQQFQQASKLAYAPCKEFFEAQAAERDRNLEKRRELVNQLQQYLHGYDFTNAVWKDVEHTLKTARAEWQTYWPVPRKAGNELQKEFESLMEQLFGKINAAYERNKDAKQALIEQSQSLVNSPDNRSATEAIKQLQTQWKAIGKSWHKEDQQLWQEFRKHCDAVFALRNQAFEAAKEQRQAVTAQAEHLIAQLHGIAEKSLEEINAAKSDIDSLSTDFKALELPKEVVKNLHNKFNDALTAIANQRDSARVKAEEKSWADLFATLDSLRDFELAVLAQQPAEQLVAKKAALDDVMANIARWPNGTLNVLQQRLGKADQLTTEDQSTNTELLRTLTIRAEILTGQESPESDKQARMAYQVKQMQSGFGQRDNRFEPLILEWVSLGAITKDVYQPLLQRFEHCRKRAIQSKSGGEPSVSRS